MESKMDTIREKLMYKDVPVLICMKELLPLEQYECVRMLLGMRQNNVSICTHDSTPQEVVKLLQKLEVRFVQCHSAEILFPDQ